MSDTPRKFCQCGKGPGGRCRFPAAPGSDFCFAHDPATKRDPERSKALAERLRVVRTPVDEWIRYANDPGGFSRAVLGIESLAYQVQVAEAVRDNKRVAWSSCNGAGKTHADCQAGLWFGFTRANTIVGLVGATEPMTRSVLWRTLQGIVARAPGLKDIEPPGDLPRLGWRPVDGVLFLGLSADQPEGLQGLHAENVLIISDEASALDRKMYEALLGNITGPGGRLLLTGNPLRSSGIFFDAFHSKRRLFSCFTTGWRDVVAANADGRIKGLIDEVFVRELVDDYGEESPIVKMRCEGIHAADASDSVIPFSLVQESRARYDERKTSSPQDGALEVGVDVARSGSDLAAIAGRRGFLALPIATYPGGPALDGPALAARVVEYVARYRENDDRVVVRIDAIGVGWACVDALKAMRRSDLIIVAINVAESAHEKEKYVLKRDEIHFNLRGWLKAGGMLPPDSKLEAELIAPTYSYGSRNRLKVQSKDEIKAVLKRSPDRADALGLACYRGGRELTGAERWLAAARHQGPWVPFGRDPFDW